MKPREPSTIQLTIICVGLAVIAVMALVEALL